MQSGDSAVLAHLIELLVVIARRLASALSLLATVCIVALAAGVAVIRRVEVVGESMAPVLLPGDRLVVLRPLPFSVKAWWPAPGEVVAVRDPRHPVRILVKRVGRVDRQSGTVEVLGDAPSASTDSRTFGPVPRSLIVGRVIYRYAPQARAGSGPFEPGYDRLDGSPTGSYESRGAMKGTT